MVWPYIQEKTLIYVSQKGVCMTISENNEFFCILEQTLKVWVFFSLYLIIFFPISIYMQCWFYFIYYMNSQCLTSEHQISPIQDKQSHAVLREICLCSRLILFYGDICYLMTIQHKDSVLWAHHQDKQIIILFRNSK